MVSLHPDLQWFLDFIHIHYGVDPPESLARSLSELEERWVSAFGDCAIDVLMYVLTRGIDRSRYESVPRLLAHLLTIDPDEFRDYLSCSQNPRNRDREARLVGEAVLSRISGDPRPPRDIIAFFAEGL